MTLTDLRSLVSALVDRVKAHPAFIGRQAVAIAIGMEKLVLEDDLVAAKLLSNLPSERFTKEEQIMAKCNYAANVASTFQLAGSVPSDLLSLIWQEIISNGPAIMAFLEKIIALFQQPTPPTPATLQAEGERAGISSGLLSSLLTALAKNGPAVLAFLMSLISVLKPAQATEE